MKTSEVREALQTACGEVEGRFLRQPWRDSQPRLDLAAAQSQSAVVLVKTIILLSTEYSSNYLEEYINESLSEVHRPEISSGPI